MNKGIKLSYNPECASNIPKKEWKRFTLVEQLLFNNLYNTMINNSELFYHPKAILLDEKLWKTTAHNASWEACEAYREAMDTLKDYKIV